MVRPLFYEVMLFLLPFLAYAGWLLARRVNPATKEAWTQAPLLRLAFAAVVTTAIGLALVGHFGSSPAGTAYVPAHMENGKMVGPEFR